MKKRVISIFIVLISILLISILIGSGCGEECDPETRPNVEPVVIKETDWVNFEPCKERREVIYQDFEIECDIDTRTWQIEEKGEPYVEEEERNRPEYAVCVNSGTTGECHNGVCQTICGQGGLCPYIEPDCCGPGLQSSSKCYNKDVTRCCIRKVEEGFGVEWWQAYLCPKDFKCNTKVASSRSDPFECLEA